MSFRHPTGRVRVAVLLVGMLFGMSAGASTLDELRWERRLVFAFGADEASRRALADLVAARACELDDRDVDVHLVDADTLVPLSEGARPLDEASADAVRRLASDAGRGLELVLVGKDGGVKRRATDVAALDDFMVAIDGMPMRRAERSADGCAGKRGD